MGWIPRIQSRWILSMHLSHHSASTNRNTSRVPHRHTYHRGQIDTDNTVLEIYTQPTAATTGVGSPLDSPPAIAVPGP